MNNTNGIHSRTRKITPLIAILIRAEYAAGKRGRDEAKQYRWRKNKFTEASKYGISWQNYNVIGRGLAWRSTIPIPVSNMGYTNV